MCVYCILIMFQTDMPHCFGSNLYFQPENPYKSVSTINQLLKHRKRILVRFSPQFLTHPCENVIRPYQSQNPNTPYNTREIRTMWHVCPNNLIKLCLREVNLRPCWGWSSVSTHERPWRSHCQAVNTDIRQVRP